MVAEDAQQTKDRFGLSSDNGTVCWRLADDGNVVVLGRVVMNLYSYLLSVCYFYLTFHNGPIGVMHLLAKPILICRKIAVRRFCRL